MLERVLGSFVLPQIPTDRTIDMPTKPRSRVHGLPPPVAMSGMWQFPPAGKQLAASAVCFAAGAALFLWGAHISYANVAPQQARIKARADLLRDHLRRKYGYEYGTYKHRPPPPKFSGKK